MSKVKVTAFSISLDGYGAGPDQSTEEPLPKLGFTETQTAYGKLATHVILKKSRLAQI